MTNISGFSSVQANTTYTNPKERKAVEQTPTKATFDTEDIFTSSNVIIEAPDPNAPIKDELSTYHSEEFVKAYRESLKGNSTTLEDYANSLFENQNNSVENTEDYPKDEDGRYVLSDDDRKKLEKIYDKADDSIHTRLMLEHGSSDAERFGEYMSDNAKSQAKVQSIARSIASGKQVPSSDEKYLQERASAIYQMAIMERMMREKADEKVKSVLDEEDKNGGSPQVADDNSGYEGLDDVPEDQLPADVKLIRAVGAVLTGDKHLSSLEGIVDISRYDGMQTSSSSASVSASVSMPSINISI